jgi:hypothetical protein
LGRLLGSLGAEVDPIARGGVGGERSGSGEDMGYSSVSEPA